MRAMTFGSLSAAASGRLRSSLAALLFGALAGTATLGSVAAAPTLRQGVAAMERQDYAAAAAILSPLAQHGNADAQLLQNFTQLDASNADFNGFPSSMIQGSYDAEGTRLHSYNRMVIATGSPPARQRYMVQLTITGLANEAVAQSNDIEAIMRGFVVAAK